MKKGQRERILEDLLQGKEINMLDDLQRYGTSCRSRISEIRADGYPVEDYVPKGERYKIYYLPTQFLKKYHSEKESA